MDLGLLFGVLATWGMIIWSLLLGSSLLGYYDTPSAVLVVGGSFMLLFITHPVRNIITTLKVVRKIFFPDKLQPETLIEELVSCAEKARRDGILSLESRLRDFSNPFMVRAMQMVIDGTDPALIQDVLDADIENGQERHEIGKSIVDALGKYAPAMGMIGTLMGLVVMLKNMDDPKKIGPGMAVAILTTLYGALISNGVCLPLSDRLARRAAEEALIKTLVLKGVLAIQAGDNPRIVEMKLRTFLPTSQRDGGKDRAAA